MSSQFDKIVEVLDADMNEKKAEAQWKLVPVEPTPEMYAAASVDSPEQGFIGAGVVSRHRE